MGDINIFIAFAAGLLSFLSPCVLPIVPSYVSYITGVSLSDLSDDQLPHRKEVVGRTIMFVLGFSLVFVALGIAFSGSAVLIGGLSSWVNMVAGGIVIILGLNVIFDFAAFLNRERRIHLHEGPRGYAGSAAVGMAFGAGWTPCIGPVLAGILFMAGAGSSVATGAILLLAYSLGLGMPFLLASFFFAPTLRYLHGIKPWLGTLRTVTGLLLVGIGLLLGSGQLQNLQSTLFRASSGLEAWAMRNPLASVWIPGMVMILLAIAPLVRPLSVLLRESGSKDSKPAHAAQGGEAAAGPASGPDTTHALFSPWRIALSGVLLVIAILHFTGILPLIQAIALWFTYEGI